jgi:Phage integrase family
MTMLSALDAAGRRRSPATLPGYHAGRPPRNKGMRYPADPPTVEEIVAVMRHAADDRHGWRVRAMIVVLWRAGLRIQEALALAEHDLDQRRRAVRVRNGKGGRRREVGMDEWGWEQLRPWLSARAQLPVGPLFCIIDGRTRGRPWSGAAVRGGVPTPRGRGRRQAPVRAAPAAPRACPRARRRGRAPQHHPAPARPRQSRHDVDLPPRDRPRGDHRHRAHAPGSDDVRQRRVTALIESPRPTSGSATALPLRPAKRASGRDGREERSSSNAGCDGAERAGYRDHARLSHKPLLGVRFFV